ncbi:MAG: hypothetical protein U1F77_06720 [Kiritimatiellia bacterium]
MVEPPGQADAVQQVAGAAGRLDGGDGGGVEACQPKSTFSSTVRSGIRW